MAENIVANQPAETVTAITHHLDIPELTDEQIEVLTELMFRWAEQGKDESASYLYIHLAAQTYHTPAFDDLTSFLTRTGQLAMN
jgi:hypothetical protein